VIAAFLVTPLLAAEMLNATAVVTALVVTVKLAAVAPAATVTVAGTVAAAVFVLVSVTMVPPVGAGPFRVTVAVDVPPPTTRVGDKARNRSDDPGSTVSTHDFWTDAYTPVIVTAVDEPCARVVIGKFAESVPSSTVTVAGTVATAVLELVRATMAPPAGAGWVRVTVPVDEVAPGTEVGVAMIEESPCGAAVKASVAVAVLT
jgi:hypothetical protein